jgi:hypothetical protein
MVQDYGTILNRTDKCGLNLPPNNALEPTPLRVDKIGRILASGSSSKAIPIYRCGAAQCWPFGALSISSLVST